MIFHSLWVNKGMQREAQVETRLEMLETKSAYQEHLIQELNEVVIQQQSQIDKLEKSLAQLREYLSSAGEQQGSFEQEAPPPHY